MIHGRVVYASPERLVAVKDGALYESCDKGTAWQRLNRLPLGFGQRVCVSSKLLRRLLRKGVHHFCAGQRSSLIIANRDTYELEGKGIHFAGALKGGRPLALCGANGAFYYGEYRSNPERSPVHIWRKQEAGADWQPVWRFTGVRHVHGVFHDPYTDALWLTTGDQGEEVGIWRTQDDFETLERIVGGSQQCRAVQLLFTKDHIYFGSDTPQEQNHIYRMDRGGKNIEPLAAVGSSVFYGCKVGEHLFFSTATEPSDVNQTRNAEVWGSGDGEKWKLLRLFKKDLWPMKYFQYGQVLFPAGPGDGANLWMTPFATAGDQRTIRVPLGKGL